MPLTLSSVAYVPRTQLISIHVKNSDRIGAI